MVDRSAGQRGEHGARRADLGVPGIVRITHDRIRIGDVEIIAYQRNAERRKQVVEKHAARLRCAVCAIVDKRDAVALLLAAA